MTKKAFITGIKGQDGAYLAKLLLEKGYEVYGGVRRVSNEGASRLEKLGILEDVQLREFDLSDMETIKRTIDENPVDEFYNLAAQSFVGTSWDKSIQSADVNGLGVVKILECLRASFPDTRYYQASSSEMFGLVQDVPQCENTALLPCSPYGSAKVYGHLITSNYCDSFGMYASSGILYNHESPLRGEQYVTRKTTHALARIARGSDEPLVLGNLEAQRDWGFAGDYVEGMWRMLQQDKADNYVLATGVSTPIRDFVRFAAECLGMELEFQGKGVDEIAIDKKTGKTVVKVSEQFFRPAEVAMLVGNASKAKDKLGWTPTVEIHELAEMMAKSDYDDLG